ncbi:MAG TPA: TetR/AcrR family transcriptional regulator [Thermoleophilaceae bacterium]|jgi:AcrR family transcriptional regulator
MASDTRERILVTTAEHFRRQGYNGTGIKQIVEDAKAPFGSVYHHFPGGKEQLGAEVIRTAGAMYGELLPAVFGPAPDLLTGARDFYRLAAQHLEESGWEDACPIATVALEVASTNEELRKATNEVFESWVAGATEMLEGEGLSPEAARRMAIAMVCALEGAFILARAGRTREPLHAAGDLIVAQLEAELAGAAPHRANGSDEE